MRQVVVGVHGGRPVYLKDVVEQLEDGPAEATNYVLYGTGKAAKQRPRKAPATSILAMLHFLGRRISGSNHYFCQAQGHQCHHHRQSGIRQGQRLTRLPVAHDLQVTVTRNYGETAKDKSDELLKHLLLATLSVTLLIALALGWRESGVVLVAIPVTLALTLAIFYFFGYTLNRVTLFALIFSIGILVDDAIVVVENIVRHFRLPENRGRNLTEVAVEAVDEVGNPTILATFAVIAAILPMAFVRGLMGPYMRPIPVGASAAMLFSLIVAFVVSPWAALRLLRHYACGNGGQQHEAEGWTTTPYRRLMTPLIEQPADAVAVSGGRGRACCCWRARWSR